MLYVVRHGQTEWNAADRVLGRTDMPLDAEGLEQARTLARSLRGFEPDVFLCSPLKRAMQTAGIISEELGVSFGVDSRLTEQDFGEYEGVNRFAAEYQEAKRRFFARFPGGESYLDMAARVYPLIKELGDADALLVTHGGVCRIIRSYFEDLSSEELVSFSQGNCELRRYGV